MEKPHSPDQIKLPRGFFIEAGASDGETISNSLYFEIKYGVSNLDYIYCNLKHIVPL